MQIQNLFMTNKKKCYPNAHFIKGVIMSPNCYKVYTIHDQVLDNKQSDKPLSLNVYCNSTSEVSVEDKKRNQHNLLDYMC